MNWKASLSPPNDARWVLETQHRPGVYEERECPQCLYVCVCMRFLHLGACTWTTFEWEARG